MKIIKLLFVFTITILLTGCISKEVEIKFIGIDGIILEVKQLEKGDLIIYPDDPLIEGHEFIGWSSYLDYAEKNVIIEALYEPFTFTVKFYDYDNDIIDEQIVEYGKSAVEAKIPEKENYIFISWDRDITNIKENLDVKPIYEKEYCEVIFKNKYGDILSTQIIKNGDRAIAPDAPNVKYYNFIKWDQDYMNVKNDLIINPVYEKIEYDYRYEDANYWLHLISEKYDITKQLLTNNQIDEYNQVIITGYDQTQVVDLLQLNKNISATEIHELINQYRNMNTYPVYNNDTKQELTPSEKDEIILNCNKSAIASIKQPQFGIITNFALMRSFPTMHYSNNYERDMFQETSLNVGEGVAIYHESLDGKWYFVQAQNYCGWIEKDKVALCNYEMMKVFLSTEKIVVVINDYVTIENAHVRMGQYFPLVNEEENNYIINFPIRNNDGKLQLKQIEIKKDENYNKGFLTYNYENLLKQSFKLLGINYSWGDKDLYGRDCASTQMGIYKCFGFNLPRNTTEQVNIPVYGIETKYGVTDQYMKTLYLPGTLIYSSGHVMMYIGEDEKGISYLFHNTSAGEGKCILQPLYQYGGNRIIGVLKLQ